MCNNMVTMIKHKMVPIDITSQLLALPCVCRHNKCNINCIRTFLICDCYIQLSYTRAIKYFVKATNILWRKKKWFCQLFVPKDASLCLEFTCLGLIKWFSCPGQLNFLCLRWRKKQSYFHCIVYVTNDLMNQLGRCRGRNYQAPALLPKSKILKIWNPRITSGILELSMEFYKGSL